MQQNFLSNKKRRMLNVNIYFKMAPGVLETKSVYFVKEITQIMKKVYTSTI